MNLSHLAFLRGLTGAALVIGLTATPGHAQITTAQPSVPELFAGELDDVGPQYLLLEKPRALPFELWSDLEITGTSNATLVENNPTFSTITSAQAGVNWLSSPRERWRGQFNWEAGIKAQVYRYGYLTGVKQVVNYLEIDRNDFDLIGGHLRANWRRGPWSASATFSGNVMRSRITRQVFYQETALEWQVYRQWSLAPQRSVAVGLDGNVRFSATDSYGLLPEGWNDRTEHGLVFLLEQKLGTRWQLEPALRVLATRYTIPGRNRTDWQESARVTLSYALSPHADLRVSGGYDRRDSNELLVANFRKWDLALAASGRWRF